MCRRRPGEALPSAPPPPKTHFESMLFPIEPHAIVSFLLVTSQMRADMRATDCRCVVFLAARAARRRSLGRRPARLSVGKHILGQRLHLLQRNAHVEPRRQVGQGQGRAEHR